ncbi:hypothetical protein ACI2TA_07575 [Ralstonia nicotianae]
MGTSMRGDLDPAAQRVGHCDQVDEVFDQAGKLTVGAHLVQPAGETVAFRFNANQGRGVLILALRDKFSEIVGDAQR